MLYNVHHALTRKPLPFENLADFIACYNPLNPHDWRAAWDPENNPEGRRRSHSLDELCLATKPAWMCSDLDNLPEPDELAEEIIENLEAGLNSFRDVLSSLSSK